MVADWIAQEVEDYFAASPIEPFFEVGRVAGDIDHPISRPLQEALGAVPEDTLTAVLLSDRFQSENRRLTESEKLSVAREEAVVNELRIRIGRRRRACLLTQHDVDRPAPYDDPELADVPVSKDCLVPLSEFDVRESTLIRNGRAYLMLPPTPWVNSSYWITVALHRLTNHVWVRLDPLMRGPASEFPQLSFRMLWYGPPLLWKNIEGIAKESFGRWLPGGLSNAGQFTDYAWVPRDDELHLFLEEVPKLDELDVAGSRYFHVVFSRSTQQVIHLDGAIRVYGPDQLAARTNLHVHRTGKVGTRIKVFRIDTPIQPDAVSSLGGTFFVWNYDVAHFFDPSVPEWLFKGTG